MDERQNRSLIPGWEHFPHQADIGIRGVGRSLEESFEQTAVALTAVITNPIHISPEKMIDINCESPDIELLLVDWLNALIYEISIKKMVFCRFKIRLEKARLQAKAWGEKINVSKHRPTVEIKGATYTQLKVYQEGDQTWVSQCVVDV